MLIEDFGMDSREGCMEFRSLDVKCFEIWLNDLQSYSASSGQVLVSQI